MNAKKLKCGRPLPKEDTKGQRAQPVDWKGILREYGEAKGLRQSDQRTQIAEVVMAIQGHFNAQDIVRKIQGRNVTIGAATVYRTLALLRDAALLKETLVDDEGSTIYEVSDGDHHDHIVCLDCGQIMEFHDERIEELQRAVLSKLKFGEIRHRHVVYARCQYLGKG